MRKSSAKLRVDKKILNDKLDELIKAVNFQGLQNSETQSMESSIKRSQDESENNLFSTDKKHVQIFPNLFTSAREEYSFTKKDEILLQSERARPRNLSRELLETKEESNKMVNRHPRELSDTEKELEELNENADSHEIPATEAHRSIFSQKPKTTKVKVIKRTDLHSSPEPDPSLNNTQNRRACVDISSRWNVSEENDRIEKAPLTFKSNPKVFIFITNRGIKHTVILKNDGTPDMREEENCKIFGKASIVKEFTDISFKPQVHQDIILYFRRRNIESYDEIYEQVGGALKGMKQFDANALRDMGFTEIECIKDYDYEILFMTREKDYLVKIKTNKTPDMREKVNKEIFGVDNIVLNNSNISGKPLVYQEIISYIRQKIQLG